MDVIDRLPCTDVVCAHGGHRSCRPVVTSGYRTAEQHRAVVERSHWPVGSLAWWYETVERMRRRSREAG